MRSILCHYVPCAAYAALLLTACGRVERVGDPGAGAGGSTAGIGGAGGSGGAAGTAGSGGSGGAGAIGAGGMTGMSGIGGGFPSLDGGTGGFGGGCANPRYASGIASAVLDGSPIRVSEAMAFGDRDVGRLGSRPGGLIAYSGSFWDIDVGGDARWHATDALQIDAVIVGDFDGDGDDDLVTREERPDEPESVVYGLTAWERTDDEGGLEARADIEWLADMGAYYAAGDVDSDGDLDLATFEHGRVVVQRNDGEFVFSRVESSAVDDERAVFWITRGAALSDRDDDGHADLWVLLLRGEDAEVLTLFGDGAGSFSPPVAHSVPDFPYEQWDVGDVAAGDVTRDGLDDFVVSTIGHIFVVQDGEPTGSAMEISENGAKLQLLDYNGDGALDIAARTYKDIEVHVSLGDGAFETHALAMGSWELDDFEIAVASENGPAQIHALYRMYCYEPCDANCARCIFGACVECMTHADCTAGLCERHDCTTGEPVGMIEPDDDAGVP